MTDLAKISVGLGVVIILLRMPLVIAPTPARNVLKAFPRSRVAAGILTVVDLAWVVWLLMDINLGWFEAYRVSIYVMAPIVWLLLMYFVDELLAVRALGGLMLLLPVPILDAARFHPSPGRFVLIIGAYAMVVMGSIFVVTPYRMRLFLNFFMRDRDDLTRWFGLAGLVVGSVLVVLGIAVF